ncbi:hypothetical protein [Microbulbifer discodermiae]|uniref:hypothetical protein n=1 Tax=Microbulbifer sp. 2201CG32-9 TaxID=3232309 RepID=UPI00345C1F8E
MHKASNKIACLLLSLTISACGGGGSGNSDVENDPGVGQPPPVSSDETTLAIAGVVEGADSGDVSILVGSKAYSASIDGGRFSADIDNGAEDDLIVITASFSPASVEVPVVFKSYVGRVSQLTDTNGDGVIDQAELPTLILSPLSSSVAVMTERAAVQSIDTAENLFEASQALPQEIILESAIALKSILLGASWDSSKYADTYALLEDYSTANRIARVLHDINPTQYKSFRASLLNSYNYTFPLDGFEDSELLFIEWDAFESYPGGQVVQLSGGAEGNGYLSGYGFTKENDNKILFSIGGLAQRELVVDVDGVFDPQIFRDAREGCALDAAGHYLARPVKRRFLKYLDTSIFSAYAVKDTFRCGETDVTFDGQYSYAQVNRFVSGDLQTYTQGGFAVRTFLETDSTIYTQGANWLQVAVVTPNNNGGITQRFDFKSGYTDDGLLSYLDNGRMALDMNRGDYMEYTPLGADGPAIKTLGILKRVDGSVVSVTGGPLVPITAGLSIPTSSRLVSPDWPFSTLDPDSLYYDLGFGFAFFADNRGTELVRLRSSTLLYGSSTAKFSWRKISNRLELRYYFQTAQRIYLSSCSEGDSDCVERRYRELEPLAQVGDQLFVRVHVERDLGESSGVEWGTSFHLASYIERFTILPN